jgi:hypothetical protein
MNPPPVLYKYEALSTQSLLNLKRQIIYFGSPLNFNDPYDCALTLNIKVPPDDELEAIRNAYLQEKNLPARVRAEFESYEDEKLREDLVHAARKAFNAAIDDFLKNKGVTCFSETNDNLLMWSHYGGRYKGFCLEFTTSAELLQKIRKVRYVPKLPRLNLSTILLEPGFDHISELFCTKSEAWKYEREWRAIHHVAGTQYTYPAEALTGVYFGPDIDQQSLEIVCLILAGQNENVKLWRGTRSSTEFRVSFEEFTYTSHLDAKRKGYTK